MVANLAVHCPLCNRPSVSGSGRISVEGVVKSYRRLLDIDVSAEFGDLSFMHYHRCSCCDVGYFDPLVSGLEGFYTSLQVFSWYYMDDKNEYGFAKSFIKCSDDVLEIGCGKGAFARHINCRSYLGLELSKEAGLLAAERGIEVVNESIQAHSISKALAYDVVCSFQVLEHVTEVRSFIESAVAALKTDGLLILSTPSADSFAALVPNFILDMPPHHVSRWSDLSFEAVADLYNLKLVQLWHEPLQYAHRELYAQTMLVDAAMKCFRRETAIWDDSALYKVVSLACRLPAKLLSMFPCDYFATKMGISVTAVFRKHVGG